MIEHDYRFHRRDDLVGLHHSPGSVYANILDEKLDFVGKLETLAADTCFLRDRLALAHPFAVHAEKSRRARLRVTERTTENVRRLYAADYARFGYSLPA